MESLPNYDPTQNVDVTGLQQQINARPTNAQVSNMITNRTSGLATEAELQQQVNALTSMVNQQAQVIQSQASSLQTLMQQFAAFQQSQFSGDYNALTNKPNIPTVPTLATVATSGLYSDLTGKPSLFNGDYNSLINKPAIPTVPTLATVATSGAYSDLTGKPTLFDGNYNSLTNKPSLFNGDYNSLTNKPTIPPAILSASKNEVMPLVALGGTYSFTITVTGATVGMVPVLEPPSGLLASLTYFEAHITATNTVTVSLKAGIAIAAGTRTFVVRVIP